MRVKSLSLSLLAALVAIATTGVVQAAAPETVPIANPGNRADTTGYGAVAYEYKIGKYEVTNTEYAEFLNAVAKSDSHELYDPRMANRYGGIERKGFYGKYSYTVKPSAAKWPVGYVTWESAARYANWLSNGMGEGEDQTEKGTYTFKFGDVKVPDHAALASETKTQWVLPSENEWYKAAYYDPDKTGGAGYWEYPAEGKFTDPEANLNSDTPTAVGAHAKYSSPYGTFDQGGNMWEYNDHRSAGKVGLRGGSFYIDDHEGYMKAQTRYDVLSAKWPNYGFRVAALGGSGTE